jgi:hypothetical protein
LIDCSVTALTYILFENTPLSTSHLFFFSLLNITIIINYAQRSKTRQRKKQPAPRKTEAEAPINNSTKNFRPGFSDADDFI